MTYTYILTVRHDSYRIRSPAVDRRPALPTHMCAMTHPRRVPELSIRKCAGRHNNRGSRWPKLSAIDAIPKAMCKRLVLVPGPRQFAPFVNLNMPYVPTPPQLTLQLFLDLRPLSPCPMHPHPHSSRCNYFSIVLSFRSICFPEWPLKLCVTSNLNQVI